MESTSSNAGALRDYGALREALERALGASGSDRAERMGVFVDLAWAALAPTGVSWLGFYAANEGDEEMILGARRDKPACSPIGMHGACGQCFRSKRALIVRDVRELGENYVACDPRDASEVVVPCFEVDGAPGSAGRVWGVLDLDSWDVGAFGKADAEGLRACLVAAGLSAR